MNAMFTTSQLGICADKVGMGVRKRSERSKFKEDLIQFYGAATIHPENPKVVISVHDSPTGHEFLKSGVTAAHFFPYKLCPDILVSLFGQDVESEKMTARNDKDAESLETVIILEGQGTTIRDLDGQRLSFKKNNRPRARNLYFLFVVAQLKMAWRHENRTDLARKLKP
ncbi:hypothetical protein B0T24DRAFT_596526 [Lasiosphaeria ovina]|uniref:Uncharacterized protein n=1 Tax=Lasiosphaeria ovina TaxID=92902 RepID=A0AAE0N1C8_9PEZI|nr:hypothetical protein B0T24DRAFT_596526 [Lasiosphaeria ovina]